MAAVPVAPPSAVVGHFIAVVAGHTGASGKALVTELIASPHCVAIIALCRREVPTDSGTHYSC